MKKWSFNIKFAIVPLLGCCIAGCKAEPVHCYPNVKNGSRFEVEVVAVADRALAGVPEKFRKLPTCPMDDVHVGDRMDITVDQLEPFREGGDGCRAFVCPQNFPTEAAPVVNALFHRFYDETSLDVCRNTLTTVEVASGCELERNVALYDPLVQGPQARDDPGEHNPLVLVRGLAWYPNNAVGYPATDCPEVDKLFPKTAGESYRCFDAWLVNLTRL